jgi:hypothetical protein
MTDGVGALGQIASQMLLVPQVDWVSGANVTGAMHEFRREVPWCHVQDQQHNPWVTAAPGGWKLFLPSTGETKPRTIPDSDEEVK